MNDSQIPKIAKKPIVSIITVTYNSADHIERTIESVLRQTYQNIEYVIIDGGSTDGTLDIIKKFSNRLSYWVSEPDEGIYHAMNKGLSHCSGQFIGVLNSDDWYEFDAVEILIKNIQKYSVDFAYGKIRMHLKNGRIMIKRPVDKTKLKTKVFQEMAIPHISLLISKEIYEKIGGYNQKYRIAADHEFLLKVINLGYRGVEVMQVVGNALDGGLSSGFYSTYESALIAYRAGKKPILVIYHSLLFLLKKMIARVIGGKARIYLSKILKSRHASVDCSSAN